ncbi:MAG: hypothetical protein IJ442_06900 [Bacteroidaceae bacterium]|nr:hypothetical protein [Bacteroidaceae bacterium]
METSQEILSRQLHDAFVTTLMKVRSQNMLLSDMYVLLTEGDESRLAIYDDLDNILTETTLTAWDDWKAELTNDETLAPFIELITATVNADELSSIFADMEYNGPFSLLLVDSQMNVISELLTIDKENILLGDEFWEKMDKELDEFYEKLMSDIHFK